MDIVLLAPAVVAGGAQMSDAQALTALLATESFMLAVVSLTATLAAPGRRRVAGLPVSPLALALGAAGVAAVAAVGAFTAWASMFWGGSWTPVSETIISGALVTAIVAQPFLALALSLGVRSAE